MVEKWFKKIFKKIIFILYISVLQSKSYYRWDVTRVELFLLLAGQIVLKNFYADQLSSSLLHFVHGWIGLYGYEVCMDRGGWKRRYILEWFPVVKWIDPMGDISCSLRRRSNLLYLAKNHFSKDLTISSDVAIFVTSKAMIRHPYDPIESRMKDTWWKVFESSYQIPPFQHKDLTPGLKFFCDFVLLEKMWAFHVFCSVLFYFDLPYLSLVETDTWLCNLCDFKFKELFSQKTPLHLKINSRYIHVTLIFLKIYIYIYIYIYIHIYIYMYQKKVWHVRRVPFHFKALLKMMWHVVWHVVTQVTRIYSYVIRISLVCGFTMNRISRRKNDNYFGC